MDGDREEAARVEAWLHTREGRDWHMRFYASIKYSGGSWVSFRSTIHSPPMHWNPRTLLESLVDWMPPVTDEDIARNHP